MYDNFDKYKYYNLIRNNIRKYRKENKLTQEQLAELIDITPRQLQRIENNESSTKISTLRKIINVLNIPDEEIIKYIRKQ